MTSRDDLVQRIEDEIATIGLTKNVNMTFKVILLNGMMKMVMVGRSKYDIVKWLNLQSNRCGHDMVPIVQDVYELVKNVELK
jgi:hypothetical protein